MGVSMPGHGGPPKVGTTASGRERTGSVRIQESLTVHGKKENRFDEISIGYDDIPRSFVGRSNEGLLHGHGRSMIVKVDLERGITPISAIRCTGRNGSCEARTLEEALEILNKGREALMFRMYGQGSSLYGMLRHHDGWIQILVEARTLSEGCQKAINFLSKKAA